MAGLTQELACVRLQNMMRRKWMKLIVLVLLLNLYCFANPDENFLIYNAQKNKCLSDNLQFITTCDPLSSKQQFRWTSENRIFNVAQKKCLGVGSKTEGSKLQWYICNTRKDLQEWECTNNTQFSLKNESLYLSLQGESTSLTLSRKQGVKSQWTIHGTTDNICSQPYQESYTLRGNGFGRPCHFPFRYKNKWYADCTIDGSSIKRLWCAIESIYEDNELWGYCPTRQTDDFWTKNPLTGMHYQINKESALTWYQARKSCQQQGGDLASITEPHEQTLISGLTQGNGPVLWTGLNSLDASSGWHWINGQTLRYLNWLSGQPSPHPGRSCGAVNQQYDSKWSTDVCSARHGYICQKVLHSPTIPPMVHTGSCPRPWIPYLGHCYYLNRAKKTWLDAKDSCRRDGGDLLSILSVEEQSFAISQLGYLKTDELWIGLNDLKTAMYFEWSDHSSVPFVSWEINEPSHNADNKEDCVIMRGEQGKWADEICKHKYGFICKKDANSTPSTNDTVIASPGCKSGWTRYGYYCYFIGTETKTFEEAKQMCVESDSYLVDITNRVENAFLVSLVGMRSEKHFWIGLSNTKDRHTFEWTNSRQVLYTHFNAGMPGRKQGCVAITTGTFAGLWDMLSCTNKEKYICKQMAVDVITTPAPTTIPAPNCSNEWFPLTNRDSCVKLFDMEREQKKTWSEALNFCRKLGGDLLSIHGPYDLHSIEHIGAEPAWIGYTIQDPSVGYAWSDGSSTSYEIWEDGEPNNYNNVENCAEINFWWGSNRGKWNDLQCEDKRNWLCEIRKGITPNEVEITTQTYNKTDDGWIIFNDNQYYISKYTSVSMEEARMFCKQKHGDLATINDEKERLFIWHQSTLYWDFYIGMIVDLDKSFTWMNGSPVVFEAWQKNQPACLNDEERCVKMTSNNGFWESVNCGEKINFVCKRSGTVKVNSTAAPIEPLKGGCAPDWVNFESKCYKIELELKTWLEARSYCRRLGGDLSSITSRLQQAYLTLLLDGHNNEDVWIGFSNLANGGYKWTDGSVISYTDWAKGQPLGSEWYSESEKQYCIAMENMQRLQQGKWITKDCNDTSGFICSRAVDHFIEPIPTKIPTTFIKLGNDSYMILQKNLTWSEAKQHCELEGAHLASIRDVLAQSYIELQTSKLGQPLWIGLNSAETDGYFLWIDNWHLNMENWGENEPKSNHPCVYVDVEGKWKTAYCNETTYSMCKKSTEIAPTPPMQYPGVCPDIIDVEPKMIWIPYRGHCYAFVNKHVSWSEASQYCLTRDANLVSIVDTKEAKFIENYVTFLGNDQEKFSIGLFKTHADHWLWLDRSVVDYTNWEESTEYDDYDHDCTFISAKTKQWGKQHCLYDDDASFICKMVKGSPPNAPLSSHSPKTWCRLIGLSKLPVVYECTYIAKPISATTGPTVDKPVTHWSLAVVAVVVVTAVLSTVAALAYVYQRRTRNRGAATFYENSVCYTTETSSPEDKDTKILVNQMENND